MSSKSFTSIVSLTSLSRGPRSIPITVILQISKNGWSTQCFGPNESNVLLKWIIRSEEHTSELQSLMRISYAVFCLKKKKNEKKINTFSTLKKSKKKQRIYKTIRIQYINATQMNRTRSHVSMCKEYRLQNVKTHMRNIGSS